MENKPFTATEVLKQKEEFFTRAGAHFDMPLSGVRIVAMCEHKGHLYIATEDGIYRKTDDKFERIAIVDSNEGAAIGGQDS